MDIRNYSREIWTHFNSEDWNNSAFSEKKSYVCAMFSELAYEHLPQFELSQKSRIKIIPSETYWNRYEARETFNISATLREMDFSDNFIIEGENLIIIGVKLRETLFITIRGTQSLNDFLIDADFIGVFHLNVNYFFHCGFLRAALKELNQLTDQLKEYSDCNIYFTGHSLGGVMSAILYNIVDLKFQTLLAENKLTLKSCYTFGMPRFGNAQTVKKFKSPFQIYNPDDVFPLVPPKLLGYRNVPLEYRLTNQLILQENRGKSTIKRLWGLLTWNDIRNHYIEGYCSRLKSIM